MLLTKGEKGRGKESREPDRLQMVTKDVLGKEQIKKNIPGKIWEV